MKDPFLLRLVEPERDSGSWVFGLSSFNNDYLFSTNILHGGVRGCPLESGEFLSVRENGAVRFPCLLRCATHPIRAIPITSVWRIPRQRRSRISLGFRPIGCIAFRKNIIIFIVVCGGQYWQPLLFRSFKLGVKSDRHFTDCQETHRQYQRSRQRRLRP